MSTQITYAGITINGCTTREFDQELMYDPSGSDLLGVRYKIGVEGFIHAQAAAGNLHGIQDLAGPTNTGATHTQFDLVSMNLAQPRQPFEMRWQGNLVLAVIPATAAAAVAGNISANMDVENGPKPRGLSVLNITPAAIKVRWSIEFTISGCPGGQSGSNLRKGPYRIINNRWSIQESMDGDFFTTRRISGSIRFAEGLTPKHAFKAAVVPGLEKGFKRESIEYDASPNGLEANYAVVDKQVHYAAPWPATSMDVTHSYSTNDGLTWLDEVSVTLNGSPNSNRQLLLQRMMQIVDARSNALRIVNDEDKQYLIENCVITEHLGEANVVNCQIATRYHGEQTRVTLANILDEHVGKTLALPAVEGAPVYDPAISTAPAIHGYDPHGNTRQPTFLYLLTCYQQDPCSQVKRIFGASQLSPPAETPPPIVEKPYSPSSNSYPLTPGNDSKYSQEHKQAAYTISLLSSRYAVDRLRVMLPLGDKDTDGSTAEIADLAPGVAMRILLYEAERIGDWPKIPSMADDYTDGEIRGHLLKYFVEPLPPTLSVDGRKKIFRVRAKACYGLNKLPTSAATLGVGVLPYTSFKPADGAFPMKNSQTTAIGP